VNPEEAHRDILDDCDNLTFQAVQELFQFALIDRHLEIEAMNTIFVHWHIKLLS
jgi:hypothetical protein